MPFVSGSGDPPNGERHLQEIKQSLSKYIAQGEAPSAEAFAEMAKAVHDLADHVVDLHRRFEKVEESIPEWTTHGWDPPAGSDPEDH